MKPRRKATKNSARQNVVRSQRSFAGFTSASSVPGPGYRSREIALKRRLCRPPPEAAAVLGFEHAQGTLAEVLSVMHAQTAAMHAFTRHCRRLPTVLRLQEPRSAHRHRRHGRCTRPASQRADGRLTGRVEALAHQNVGVVGHRLGENLVGAGLRRGRLGALLGHPGVGLSTFSALIRSWVAPS